MDIVKKRMPLLKNLPIEDSEAD